MNSNSPAPAPFDLDVCVVCGCGHAGLPLAIAFADAGLHVGIYDINASAVDQVNGGGMPFLERGAEPLLAKYAGKTLHATTDGAIVSRARHVVVIIGTPVDEHLNPTFYAMRRFILTLLPHLRAGQCIIMRSTLFPGTTDKINALMAEHDVGVHVAFCPERIAEGHALRELRVLPQIVAGCTPTAETIAKALFEKLSASIIILAPLEAELAKIFTNSWRYIQFATANQFFMIAADYGLDFYRIYDALTRDYPRMSGLPRSGFTAGPCLFKDTMQLAAANNNNFYLGHAAMLVNEGLPNFIIKHLKDTCDLQRMKVGILGMAFKADSDDPRSSLSYKLRKILEYEAAAVLCTDEYIQDSRFKPAEDVVREADLLIVGTPHTRYRELDIPPHKKVIDVWNFFGRGAALR